MGHLEAILFVFILLISVATAQPPQEEQPLKADFSLHRTDNSYCEPVWYQEVKLRPGEKRAVVIEGPNTGTLWVNIVRSTMMVVNVLPASTSVSVLNKDEDLVIATTTAAFEVPDCPIILLELENRSPEPASLVAIGGVTKTSLLKHMGRYTPAVCAE